MSATMKKIGLALSGGGFRASLYHLGLVRFLRDAGILSRVSQVTSVSGGSIVAAHLVLNWGRYRFARGVRGGGLRAHRVRAPGRPQPHLAALSFDTALALAPVAFGAALPQAVAHRLAGISLREVPLRRQKL